ncbi:hypothetical protein DQW09_13240 [Ensifer adhaerens]|nr:hypothetical protein DQW09_13240 [Ensifer adhaerens]THA67020.1 hypothetical protein E5176_09525 [Ensifer adhaerens]
MSITRSTVSTSSTASARSIAACSVTTKPAASRLLAGCRAMRSVDGSPATCARRLCGLQATGRTPILRPENRRTRGLVPADGFKTRS